jgi:hypothetical protein
MSVKIFLSAVSREFGDYRDQLRSDLTRPDVDVKVQEDFKDFGVVMLDKLDYYISCCDAVVHLVGDMAGSDAEPASTTSIITKYPDITDKLPPLRDALASGLGISYTQWEAWLALYHGKALVIAKAENAAPRGPKYAPTKTSRAAQEMHLQRLRAVERYPGFTFTSLDNLAKQIAYGTILDLLAKQKRGQPAREALGLPLIRNDLAYVQKISRTENPLKSCLDPFARFPRLESRTVELSSLANWATNERPISIKVLTGPAGIGKTRMAVELCNSLDAQGWVTGFLTPFYLTRYADVLSPAIWHLEQPTLVVLDDAISFGSWLKTFLAEISARPGGGKSLRLLLIDRYISSRSPPYRDWFGASGWENHAWSLLDPKEPVEIGPLKDIESRRSVFSMGISIIDSDLRPPMKGYDQAFDNWLGSMSWTGIPCYLLMAGVFAGKSGISSLISLRQADVVSALAKSERERLAKIITSTFGAGPTLELIRLAERTMGFVTLVGEPTRADLEGFTQRQFDKFKLPQPNEFLEVLYNFNPANGNTVHAISPRPVGEAFVYLSLIDTADADEIVVQAFRLAPENVITLLSNRQFGSPLVSRLRKNCGG